MRLLFRNSAMAAAFVAAVLAQSDDHDKIRVDTYPDIDDLPDRDVRLEITTSEPDEDGYRGIDIEISSDAGGTLVHDVLGFNYWVNNVVPVVGNGPKTMQVRGHNVTINRDGSVTVGCKTFNKENVERVIGVAKRLRGHLGFRTFQAGAIRVHQYSDTEINFDNDGRINIDQVEEIAKARAEFLERPALTLRPFHLLA